MKKEFLLIKEKIVVMKELVFPDYGKLCLLRTDASNFAM